MSNRTLVSILLAIFSASLIASVSWGILAPKQLLEQINKASVKFLLVLLWNTFVLFGLAQVFYWFYRPAPIDMIKMCRNVAAFFMFYLSGSPFLLLSVERIYIAESGDFTLTLGKAAATGSTYFVVCAIFWLLFSYTYVALCAPRFSSWAKKQPS